MARIIGLSVAIPGMWRKRKAAAAIAPPSNIPGNKARAERMSDRVTFACVALRFAWCVAIVIGVAPFGTTPNIGPADKHLTDRYYGNVRQNRSIQNYGSTSRLDRVVASAELYLKSLPLIGASRHFVAMRNLVANGHSGVRRETGKE